MTQLDLTRKKNVGFFIRKRGAGKMQSCRACCECPKVLHTWLPRMMAVASRTKGGWAGLHDESAPIASSVHHPLGWLIRIYPILWASITSGLGLSYPDLPFNFLPAGRLLLALLVNEGYIFNGLFGIAVHSKHRIVQLLRIMIGCKLHPM